MNPKIELLKICIAVENTVSEIYDLFAARFPEQEEFWRGLATEERGHARQFVVASSLKGSAALPSSMQSAQDALEYVRKVKREILENAGLQPEDALKMAIFIEQTTVESFLDRMVLDETDGEMKRFYGSLMIEGKRHAEFLEERLSGMRQSGGQA